MRDHDALVDKGRALRDDSKRVGDKWGQDNDSTEPGYVWGYTLGVLLILLGFVFSFFDWSWITTAENPDATLIDMSPLFWFGIAVFVSGCFLMDKRGIGWYLLFACLGIAGWTFFDGAMSEQFDESQRMFYGEITAGILLFLLAQIWYWRRSRRSSEDA